MKSAIVGSAVFIIGLSITGCLDGDRATRVEQDKKTAVGAVESLRISPDDLAESFAKEHPGYAGFRLTLDNRVEVFISREDRIEPILAEVEPLLDRYLVQRRPLSELPRFGTLVDFDLAQLQPWRRQVRGLIGTVPITMIRIDSATTNWLSGSPRRQAFLNYDQHLP